MSEVSSHTLYSILLTFVLLAKNPTDEVLQQNVTMFVNEIERVYGVPHYKGVSSLFDSLEELRSVHQTVINIISRRVEIEGLVKHGLAYYSSELELKQFQKKLRKLREYLTEFKQLYAVCNSLGVVQRSWKFFDNMLTVVQKTIIAGEAVRTRDDIFDLMEEYSTPTRWYKGKDTNGKLVEDLYLKHLYIHFPFLDHTEENWEDLELLKSVGNVLDYDDLLNKSEDFFTSNTSKYKFSSRDVKNLKRFCHLFVLIDRWYQEFWSFEPEQSNILLYNCAIIAASIILVYSSCFYKVNNRVVSVDVFRPSQDSFQHKVITGSISEIKRRRAPFDLSVRSAVDRSIVRPFTEMIWTNENERHNESENLEHFTEELTEFLNSAYPTDSKEVEADVNKAVNDTTNTVPLPDKPSKDLVLSPAEIGALQSAVRKLPFICIECIINAGKTVINKATKELTEEEFNQYLELQRDFGI